MKVKIVNRKRFFKSTGILLAMIIFIIIIGIASSVFSHKETTYKTIYVSSGETLWEISKQEQISNNYYLNKDIRFIIDDIKNLNNLHDSNLYINQELIIPIN